MASVNDTDGAEVVDGFNGSRSRLRTETGDLEYKTLSFNQEHYRENSKLKKGAKNIKMALEYGLPPVVHAEPLACNCYEGHLVGATRPVNGFVEADYMCDYGYHNYMVFRLLGVDLKGQTQLKVNANGDIVETSENNPGQLGEL